MDKIKLVGHLDDEFTFPELLGQSETIEVDLGEVKLMNSLGIRSWVDWIEGFSRYQSVRFVRVPIFMVQQISMILNFLPPNGRVESFFLPYYSEETDETKELLVRLDDVYVSGQIRWPTLQDSEGEEMEVDVTERVYSRLFELADEWQSHSRSA